MMQARSLALFALLVGVGCALQRARLPVATHRTRAPTRMAVRFRTLVGEKIETTTRVGTPIGLRPGREVPVTYDPAKLTSAEIDSFRERDGGLRPHAGAYVRSSSG